MLRPKFADVESWELADRLMQPALIRTIDNIRKQLEVSTWKGEYREYPIWPEAVPEETRAQVALLQQELKTATPEQVDAIGDALAQLPTPMQGYELRLTQGEAERIFDVWELCYRICFSNADRIAEGDAVVVDRSLLEADTQDVDWTQLEEKTKAVIGEIFGGGESGNDSPNALT
jgi:hypothetical protein